MKWKGQGSTRRAGPPTPTKGTDQGVPPGRSRFRLRIALVVDSSPRRLITTVGEQRPWASSAGLWPV